MIALAIINSLYHKERELNNVEPTYKNYMKQ